MNTFNIERSFKTKKEKGWDTLWWCIDIHDTICKSNYKHTNKPSKFYKDAKKVLQFLSRSNDNILILYTCSHKKRTDYILKWLGKNNIYFSHINCNPNIVSNKLSNFSKKFYFNIMLDDKAGFEGETDWTLIKEILEKEYGPFKTKTLPKKYLELIEKLEIQMFAVWKEKWKNAFGGVGNSMLIQGTAYYQGDKKKILEKTRWDKECDAFIKKMKKEINTK